MKKLSFILTLFFAAAAIYSASITFPIKGFQTVSYNAVPIEVEWEESWFGRESSTIYNHKIARAAGILAEVSYVDVKGHHETNELVGCYKSLGVKNNLIELHYNVDYTNTMWGNDQAAFSFATKQIESAHGKRNLIFVVIRGTPLNANEWISNLNISDRTQTQQEFHEGFLRATKQVENALIAYLLKNKIDIEDCFLLITGHSRGAAIANLLAAQLWDTGLFNTDNIYAYTFASPNVTTNENVNDSKYNYIWNIVNAEDIVPTVPMNYGQWKFKKYGHTKTIINSWNTDPTKYEYYYLPMMNIYYNRFLERDFCPFKIGPFLPIEVSAIVTNLNGTVTAFYSGIKELRSKAETAFWKIFPPKNENSEASITEEELPKATDHNQSTGLIANLATGWIYKQFGVDKNYLINCFIDMHAMESYLSWILALTEEDVYSEQGCSFVVLTGSCDYAIFDEAGNRLATILDGKVDFSKVKEGAATSSFLQDCVAIGLPANRDYTLVLSKESLLPTKMSAKIQHYNAAGILIEETEPQFFYPSKGKLYSFKGGSNTFDETSINAEKIKGKQVKEIRKNGDIVQTSVFKVQGELSGSSSGTFNIGVHAGTNNFYGSLLLGHNTVKIGRSLELSPGFGHQSILMGRINLDTEFFTNFFYALSDDFDEDEKRFNIVPSLRFSLSFKPKHRLQFFAGTNLDLHISNFNDAAFDTDYRVKAGEVDTQTGFKIVPNLQIGIRF